MQLSNDPVFLPGVPANYIRERLEKADGHELSSGKLASDESSAALAVNAFGWFHDRPERLPLFSTLGLTPSHADLVEVEYCARFPWSGGRHPWLDAWIETPQAVIGVESKRFEPYRGKKKDKPLSLAYNRPVWHDRMGAYETLRDGLRSGTVQFHLLDAVQLMKHALGMVTEGRRKSKRPCLVYLFAEPTELGGRLISDEKSGLTALRSPVSPQWSTEQRWFSGRQATANGCAIGRILMKSSYATASKSSHTSSLSRSSK